jgi:hypothetical protein
MTKSWTRALLVMVGVALVAGVLFLSPRWQDPAAAQGGGGKGGGAGPHYTVIETNGQNLLVTDNATNTLYYYSIDKEEKIGAPLKLRASVDLSQVGTAEIKIKPINPQK